MGRRHRGRGRVVGFLAFLYNIPPFFLTPPEAFGADMAKAAPPVDGIADPAQRAIAARGRHIVMNTGCIGCHATNGPQGPDLTKYLPGGGIKIVSKHGTFVSRNLTPDPETGLARRTDEEVKRVLRSGIFPDGHVVLIHHHAVGEISRTGPKRIGTLSWCTCGTCRR